MRTVSSFPLCPQFNKVPKWCRTSSLTFLKGLSDAGTASFELDLCWVKTTVDADMEGSKVESVLLSVLGTLRVFLSERW